VRKRPTGTPRRDDVYPLISPDGQRIVFTRTKGPNEAAADLFTMIANGTNVRRLTNTPKCFKFTRSWQPLAS
jgi:Tol biopolymer transport system component